MADGWQVLDPSRPRERMILGGYTAVAVGGIAFQAPSLFRTFLPDAPLWALLLSIVVALGLLVGLPILVVVLRPRPRVDFSRGVVRLGASEFPYSAIHVASIGPMLSAGGHPRGVILGIGPSQGRQTRIPLARGDRVLLDDAHRDRLVRVIELSSIHLPESPYDPTGRFARYNFPGYVSKEAALDAVRDPLSIDPRGLMVA